MFETKYWYKTGADANWTTVTGNWWDDAAHTQQSAAVPGVYDYVYLLGTTAPATGPASSISFLIFDASGLDADLADTVTTNVIVTTFHASYESFLIFGYGSRVHKFGGVAGDNNERATCIFSGSSENHGTLYGDAIHFATFSGSAKNYGNAGDYAVFNDSSYNYEENSVVGDYATFNDASLSYKGTIGDYATFNGSAGLGSGMVGDHAIFNNDSGIVAAPLETIVGQYAIFNDDSYVNYVGAVSVGDNWRWRSSTIREVAVEVTWGTDYIDSVATAYETVHGLENARNIPYDSQGRIKTSNYPSASPCGDNSFAFALAVEPRESKVVEDASSSYDDAPSDYPDRLLRTTTHVLPILGSQWTVTPEITQNDPDADPAITLYSENEAVQSMTDSGESAYVGEGVIRFYAVSAATDQSPSKTVYTDPLQSVETQADSYQTTSYIDDVGSLREALSNAIDDVLALDKDINIFTTQNHPTGEYVRNANCWAAGFDLTCISPWNSASANKKAGVLISSRHVVFAHHYYPPNGTTIRFVKADGTVVDKTLIASQRVGSTDIRIGVLDSDVPAGIGFAQVLPADWNDYIPAKDGIPAYIGKNIPVMVLDQEEKALVHDINHVGMVVAGGPICVKTESPSYATPIRQSYYEPIVVGDSGNGICALRPDAVILLACLEGIVGFQSYGPFLSEYITEINAVMAALDAANGFTPNKTLTEYDISAFNTYE